MSRLHARLDTLISTLSKVSERVARIEALAELKSAAPQKNNKVSEYAGKGGLVVAGGVMVELLRQLVELFKN